MTNRIIYILGFLIIYLPAIHAQEQEAEPESDSVFTLQECINYALEHNQTLIKSNLDREISKSQVSEVIAQGLPQINANANLTYNINLQQVVVEGDNPFIPPNGGGDGPVTFALGTKYSGNAAIELTQLIFNGSYFVGFRHLKL
nr:TolC family protein [Mangrovivirga cuniculi]